MARIPEAEIERLKREIALERLVEARGMVLKRKGADLTRQIKWKKLRPKPRRLKAAMPSRRKYSFHFRCDRRLN